MIIQVGETPDTLNNLGISYFLTKYGFPESSDSLYRKLIFYGDDPNDPQKHSIFIAAHPVTERPSGYMKLNDYHIPVFESPSNLGDYTGEPLSWFVNNDISYPCIAKSQYNTLFGIDIFRETGNAFLGNFDQHWIKSCREQQEIVKSPFIDILCDSLFNAVKKELIIHRKVPLVHTSFWPEGKKFALCLTHDVDEVKKSYQWITHTFHRCKKFDIQGVANQVRSFGQKIRGFEPYWTFENLMKIEGQLGVRSSLYFLNETGKFNMWDKPTWRFLGRRYNWHDKKISTLVRKLLIEGWDVGLHGSFYSYNDPEKLKSEKISLESVLETKVIGTRQHNLNLQIPDTWAYQEQAGLEYDTTLGFNHCIGFRWGICFPFRPFYKKDDRILNLIEIPLTVEDNPLMKQHDSWGEFVRIMDEVRKRNGVLTLLWHHTLFNEYEFPGVNAFYRKIIEYCQKNGAWVANAKDISDWWKSREEINYSIRYSNRKLAIISDSYNKSHYFSVYSGNGLKVTGLKNASIVREDPGSVHIRTKTLEKGDSVEIIFSEYDK